MCRRDRRICSKAEHRQEEQGMEYEVRQSLSLSLRENSFSKRGESLQEKKSLSSRKREIFFRRREKKKKEIERKCVYLLC